MKKILLVAILLMSISVSYGQNLLGLNKSQIRKKLEGLDYTEYSNNAGGTTFKLVKENAVRYYTFTASLVCNAYYIIDEMDNPDMLVNVSDQMLSSGWTFSKGPSNSGETYKLIKGNMIAKFYTAFTDEDGEEKPAMIVIKFR
jgi:hypothetical protein